MKSHFFTLLAVAVAAALAQDTPSPDSTTLDGPSDIETFPSIGQGTATATVSFTFIPPDLPTTLSGSSNTQVTTGNATGSTTGAATATTPAITATHPASLSTGATKPAASATTTSTTGAASSVRAASVPLAVVACVLGASQIFF